MSNQPTSPGDRPEAGRYEIRLTGHLDGRWAARFDGLAVTAERGGTTVIAGPIADQAALHGLLQRVRDLGLPLVSVTRVDTDPAETTAARTTTEHVSYQPATER
jgi:hypothetical protein